MFRRHPVLGERLKRYGTSRHRQHDERAQHPADAQLQVRPSPDALNVSGEYMADHALTGVKSSCIHCPVTCGRDVEVEGVGR